LLSYCLWNSVFKSFAEAAQQDEEVRKQDSEDEFVTVTKETDEYLGYPLQNHTASPLDWWRDHAPQFPHLAKLSRKFLSTPASSVYSERLFSELKRSGLDCCRKLEKNYSSYTTTGRDWNDCLPCFASELESDS